MQNIRVGLLGAGGIATAHAQTVTSLAGVELVGVADLDGHKARRLAERFGVGWFASLQEMMAAARPDVVHILLPPDLHARFAIEAMTAGANVLVEKPLCISEDECRAIEHTAQQLGRVVGVNHNVTFSPAFLRLIDVIRSRRIGAVQHVNVYWCVPFGDNTFTAPLFRRHGAGAVMLETGPHPLSTIVALVGRATAATALVTDELRRAPDTWQLAFKCEHGTAQCFIGIARSFTEMRVRVIGEDGVVDADLRLGNVTVIENTRYSPLFYKLADTLALAGSLASSALRSFVGLVGRIPAGGATEDLSPMMRGSIGNFYDSLRAGVRPSAGLEQGLAVVRTCLSAVDAVKRTGEQTTEEVKTWRTATASS